MRLETNMSEPFYMPSLHVAPVPKMKTQRQLTVRLAVVHSRASMTIQLPGESLQQLYPTNEILSLRSSNDALNWLTLVISLKKLSCYL